MKNLSYSAANIKKLGTDSLSLMRECLKEFTESDCFVSVDKLFQSVVVEGGEE